MRGSNTCRLLVRTLLPALGALLLLSGCATTPREVDSQLVRVRLESRTVMKLPGLAPQLVTYSNKRTVFVLQPDEQPWRMPRMSRPELQEMVAHCAEAGGRQVLQVSRAVLEDGDGTVLATFLADGSVTLPELSQHTDGPVALAAPPVEPVLRLAIDPDRFHGRLREELELTFRDGQTQIVPGVRVSVVSMSTTPQQMSVGGRTASINNLYVRLDNRSRETFALNGYNSGAMEAGGGSMLTAEGFHDTILPPGRSMIVRLPIELSEPLEAGGWQSSVTLDDYLAGWEGVIDMDDEAVQLPLRVQVELQAASGKGRTLRGVLTPTVEARKRYRIEQPGCFDE